MGKKIIKLTENELHELIENTIHNLVSCDYSAIVKPASYSNPLTIAMMNRRVLDEGLVKTYPIKKTVEYIKSYFNLRNLQIKTVPGENGVEQILVLAPSAGDNIKIMEKAMNYFGYYLATPKPSENQRLSGGFVWLQFEPKFIEDISSQLRKEEKYLYHITPSYNEAKIKKLGFSPRAKNSMFNYPNRVYFIRGSVNSDEIMSIGEQLCQANRSDGNDGTYTVFTVDVDRIPETVPFYFDSNYKYGVYTNHNIKPDTIVGVKNMEF